MDISSSTIPTRTGTWRIVVLIASGLLLAFIAACFGSRADAVATITVYPPWFWVGLGLLLTCVGYRRRFRIPFAALLVAWTFLLFAFADSPASLFRSFTAYERPSNSIRVVTLNCANNAGSANEIVGLEPDVVLFQQSPKLADLQALSVVMFGTDEHVVWGGDTAVLASGEITPVKVPEEYRGNFVHARVQVSGRTLDVISLRLLHAPVRFDLWSPSCWAAYRENREEHLREMSVIAGYIATLPDSATLVVGGDFNAPPGDPVFDLLEPRLRDVFPRAGLGWGATVVNEVPVIRIDQVWSSAALRPLAAFAREMKYTDHRMVVVDLEPAAE